MYKKCIYISKFSSFQLTEFPNFQVSKFPREGGREGWRANERPGTDHVISGTMRSLKKTST